MPWLHLHVDTGGKVKACCETNITFGNINDQSIEQIWEGQSIRKFRKFILAGQRDRRCAACFKKEAAGKSSMRLETLEKFDHRMNWVEETDQQGYSADSKPIYFDIRFNNLCNLRCRTCWHGASSSWFEEAKILKQNASNKAIIEASTDSESLISELLNQGVAVEEIYFAGGEPLMMKAHYDLLEGLISQQQTQVHLRYNTNLSTLNLKERNVLGLWKYFKQVTVSASIDAMGKKGEYVRKGLSWEKFIFNMQMIKTGLPDVKLEIAPTISVFNILSLGELHQYFVDEGLIATDAIYLNVLSRPDYYNVKVFPEHMKKLASKLIMKHIGWMKRSGATPSVIKEFESVDAFMNQEDWTHQLPKLKKQLQVLDEMRSESYRVLFPDIKKVLDRV